MAIVTKQLAVFEQGVCIFEYDYDDVKLFLTALRCINNGDQPAWGKATSTLNGRSYELTFPANTVTEINIPGNAARGLSVTVREDGKIDGVDYQVMYPA